VCNCSATVVLERGYLLPWDETSPKKAPNALSREPQVSCSREEVGEQGSGMALECGFISLQTMEEKNPPSPLEESMVPQER